MKEISVHFHPSLKYLSTSACKTILKIIFLKEKVPSYSLSVIFDSEDLLNNLKRQFFYKDHDTDVIAFRLNEYENKMVEGEIYICIPIALENAKLYKENDNREISRLIIHGAFHLMGFEDGTDKEKKIMTQKEDFYLNILENNKIFLYEKTK